MENKILITDISRLISMDDEIGNIDNASIIVSEHKIEWVGKSKNIPKGNYEEISAGNGLVTPGLIDCHTHIVHAGTRENEFALRAKGATYQEIANVGGGIMSTVNATRVTTEEELLKSTLVRIDEAKSFGTTFLEIKSGYGLSMESEEKILNVIDKLYAMKGVNVVGTFLGAHVVPSEYKSDRKKYLELLIDKMIPMASKHKSCKFVDIFVENGAFSSDEAKLISKKAKEFGFGIKLHVDQFTDLDGANLAVELGAVSADHLDRSSDNGLKKMAEKGVVGVLLPGASMFMKEKLPNARKMIDLGVNVAISTDYNPGTSPVLNLVFMASLGVMQMGMTVDEAWRAITINAAKALKLGKTIGSIKPGKLASLTVFNATNEALPLYKYTSNLVTVSFT